MRVGLDYLPAVTHFPGVGRYARELVRALAAEPGSPALALLEAGGGARAIGEPHLGLAGAAADGRVRRHRWRVPRRALALACRLSGRGVDRWMGGVDVFHRIHVGWPPVTDAVEVQPVGELPAPGSAADRALGRALARFDHLLAMSAHGAGELVRRYGFDAARVHAVPIGCDQWRRALPAPPPRADPPIVIVLGAVQPRRRHVAVVRAFEALREDPNGVPDARLVLLGGPGAAADALREHLAASPHGDAVEWRRGAVESELPLTVATASALVHLTEGEESAVTPLEAFSFGTPVVATRLGAFEEALDGEAELVENAAAEGDAAELGRALARAVASSRDAGASARREAVARRYPWSHNARATVAVWQAAER